MTAVLYAIFIFPLEQIIEIIYTIVYKIFDTVGISVLGVSLAVTFLCLPLYVVAEKWQQLERDTIAKLRAKTQKIKQVFKGDEQYMILSTYYRQNHYHPVYALRNSLGILIQIPFFVAAYRFLSHLEPLRGASFLFINDLGKPDSLLHAGGFSINALPLVMTVVNCVSGAVYTKGLGLRDKAQVYGTAGVFLVLLYNAPAGLALYWTMNNVLSLVKNVFYKLQNPLKVLYIILSIFTLVFIAYLLFINEGILKKRLIMASCSFLVLLTPIIVKLIRALHSTFLFPLLDDSRQTFFLFFVGCAALVALAGIAIPSSVIVSSPEEFSFIDSYQSPLPFVFNTFAKSFGLLLVWPACVYFLFGKKIKSLLGLVFAVLSLFALVNCFIFQGNYTTISNTFKFNSIGGLNTSALLSLLNVLCAAFIFIILAVLIKYQRTWIINSGLSLVLFSLILFSGYNVFFIHKSFKNLLALKKTSRTDIRGIQPIFSFAKDKPNIMVIMSDCAISGFVKPIFDEHPVLYTQFDGFTLFPNTLSFAKHTLMGVPSVWGGYEYTPEEMNRRNAVSMVDKHNEALLLIPTVLSGLGYHITVTDPSWANYDSINDTSIYDRLENVTALNTIGRYTNLWYSMTGFTQAPVTSGKINRNALWFSFLKCAPPYLRKLIYDDGWYWGTDEYVESITTFLNSYAVLDFLPGLTVYDSESPSALLITNEATHDLFFLQYPSYTPVEAVTDTGKGEFSDSKNYHVNSAFYLKTGEWFDELRKNGVYDNTRIIIVSDHGSNINAKIADTDIAIQDERREGYNPVLLVKDFNSHGALRTDMAFMTNADVPFLTLDGIADTVNPFTGKSLKENPKNEGVYITTNHLPQAYSHNKYTFKINYNQWLHVRDTIFEAENWVYKNPFDRQAEEKK